MIPVDVANANDEDVWTNSVNLNSVIEGLRRQAPAATHYVVFDARRNGLKLTRKGKKALSDKGFVPIAYTPYSADRGGHLTPTTSAARRRGRDAYELGKCAAALKKIRIATSG